MSTGASILDQLPDDANVDWNTKVMRHRNAAEILVTATKPLWQTLEIRIRRKGRQSLLFGVANARAQKNFTYEGRKQQWNIHGAIYTQYFPHEV